MSKSTIIINYCILSLVILFVTGELVFRNHQYAEVQHDNKNLIDSISVLSSKIDSSKAKVAVLQQKVDSLSSLEAVVITRTNDKIRFIYSNATPAELDSIIRAAIKVQPRYH